MTAEHKKRVLIVDADENILCILQRMLEDAGFDTSATWSGHEALELLKKCGFDVLLVDDYLPDLHAADFLNRVAKLPARPRIVVTQSRKPDISDLRKYYGLGASAVVRKHHLGEVHQAV